MNKKQDLIRKKSNLVEDIAEMKNSEAWKISMKEESLEKYFVNVKSQLEEELINLKAIDG